MPSDPRYEELERMAEKMAEALEQIALDRLNPKRASWVATSALAEYRSWKARRD